MGQGCGKVVFLENDVGLTLRSDSNMTQVQIHSDNRHQNQRRVGMQELIQGDLG